MKTTCGQCVYWEPPVLEDDAIGECRRNPPHVCCMAYRRDNPVWPETAADGWCGQARAREPEPDSVVEAARRVVEAFNGHDPDNWHGDLDLAVRALEAALERVKP